MANLNSPFTLETAFDEYVLDEQIGEGGAGRVYAGRDSNGDAVAVKILTHMSKDKRGRFKNEIAFLLSNRHPNIVNVLDCGIALGLPVRGPFYVMKRYHETLRSMMTRRLDFGKILPLFLQILDGVEAAHLLGVVHRDLKPENILFDSESKKLLVADFGIASFDERHLITLVETAPNQRLANFQYASPEQRSLSGNVSHLIDIYALGLMLNEMFTGSVPQGTSHRLIKQVSVEHGFLDDLVDSMIKQNPLERIKSILDVKQFIEKNQSSAIAYQKLDSLKKTVISADEIDNPLALNPPTLTAARWEFGTLTLTLDRPVTSEWVAALRDMGNHNSIMGSEPSRFTFQGNIATGPASETSAQNVINYFKSWLPKATNRLRQILEDKRQRDLYSRREALRIQRERQEKLISVNNNLVI